MSSILKKYKTMADLDRSLYGDVDDDPEDFLNKLRTGGTINVTVKKQTSKAKEATKKKRTPAKTTAVPYDAAHYPIPDNFYNSDGIVDLDLASDYLESDLYEINQGVLAQDIDDGIGDLFNMLDSEVLKKILLNILHDLAKDGNNDFIFIKHELARQYYEKYTDVVNNIQKAYSMVHDRERRRAEALNKLTPEERDLLGL